MATPELPPAGWTAGAAAGWGPTDRRARRRRRVSRRARGAWATSLALHGVVLVLVQAVVLLAVAPRAPDEASLAGAPSFDLTRPAQPAPSPPRPPAASAAAPDLPGLSLPEPLAGSPVSGERPDEPAPALRPEAPAAAADERAPTTRARLLAPVDPQLPWLCLRRQHYGMAVVEVAIDAEGRPDDPRLVRSTGCEALDEAAIQAALASRFLPAARGGEPVPTRERLAFRFDPPS